MRRARKKSKAIHAINDIHTYILQHPEDDRFLKAALDRSGYLKVWQKEFARNRWHYDIEMMRQVGKMAGAREGLIWYCKTTVAGAGEGRRFEINKEQYTLFAAMTESETLRALANLHDTLDRHHKQRVRVAAEWLMESSQDLSF